MSELYLVLQTRPEEENFEDKISIQRSKGVIQQGTFTNYFLAGRKKGKKRPATSLFAKKKSFFLFIWDVFFSAEQVPRK